MHFDEAASQRTVRLTEIEAANGTLAAVVRNAQCARTRIPFPFSCLTASKRCLVQKIVLAFVVALP